MEPIEIILEELSSARLDINRAWGSVIDLTDSPKTKDLSKRLLKLRALLKDAEQEVNNQYNHFREQANK